MAGDATALRVFFLDVGQGDCTFVVPPEGEGVPILFDCADAYVAERFVANHTITCLSAVVASHLDIDHVRGMLPFLKTHFGAHRRVEKLVMFPDRAPKAGRNAGLRELMAAALEWEKNPPHRDFELIPNFRTARGPVLLARGADWSVKLVLPWMGCVAENLVEAGNDPNACSSVLSVERGGTRVLIGGDAPLGSWERLEAGERPARVIRVPHHGGEIREGGEVWKRFTDLYDSVAADTSVVSVGTNNQHHPVREHISAARRGNACRLLCTQLTPRCHPDPTEVRDEALAGAGLVEWPYRHRAVPGDRNWRPHGEVPCAGSVVAWIDAAGNLEVEPAPKGEHDRLLLRVAHALCQPPPIQRPARAG